MPDAEPRAVLTGRNDHKLSSTNSRAGPGSSTSSLSIPNPCRQPIINAPPSRIITQPVPQTADFISRSLLSVSSPSSRTNKLSQSFRRLKRLPSPTPTAGPSNTRSVPSRLTSNDTPHPLTLPISRRSLSRNRTLGSRPKSDSADVFCQFKAPFSGEPAVGEGKGKGKERERGEKLDLLTGVDEMGSMEDPLRGYEAMTVTSRSALPRGVRLCKWVALASSSSFSSSSFSLFLLELFVLEIFLLFILLTLKRG